MCLFQCLVAGEYEFLIAVSDLCTIDVICAIGIESQMVAGFQTAVG